MEIKLDAPFKPSLGANVESFNVLVHVDNRSLITTRRVFCIVADRVHLKFQSTKE